MSPKLLYNSLISLNFKLLLSSNSDFFFLLLTSWLLKSCWSSGSKGPLPHTGYTLIKRVGKEEHFRPEDFYSLSSQMIQLKKKRGGEAHCNSLCPFTCTLTVLQFSTSR